MQILKTVAELRSWSREIHKQSGTVGLVPTMGALHEGHLSLVQASKESCTATAVSIFVNPTQFGPNEDFAKYPRTFEADCDLLRDQKVDIVFAPSPDEIYRPGAVSFVEVEGLSDRLDGTSRPGHFRGVATVVAKLLIAAEPHQAFFGQKDAAQVAVIRRMVSDLLIPVEVVVCPIVREPDGLAMSSRNRYLNSAERTQALILSKALAAIQAELAQGMSHVEHLRSTALKTFATEPEVRVDYIAAVDWSTLIPVQNVVPGTLIAVAAWVGNTRLIDNFIAE